MSRRRGKVRKGKGRDEEPMDEETFKKQYEILRGFMFEDSERFRELMKTQGYDIGEIKDCAPIYLFRCDKCRSRKTAVLHFSKAIIMTCLDCDSVEMVGAPEKVKRKNP